MARRTVNGFDMDSFAADQPEPWEIAAAMEAPPSDRPPTVIVMGCRAWPTPYDHRTSDGRMECGACHGNIRAPHFCAVCSRPRGTGAKIVAKPEPKPVPPAEPPKPGAGGKPKKGKAKTGAVPLIGGTGRKAG